MSPKPSSPFGSTRALENELDEFLDIVSDAGLVFKAGVSAYLDKQLDLFVPFGFFARELARDRRESIDTSARSTTLAIVVPAIPYSVMTSMVASIIFCRCQAFFASRPFGLGMKARLSI